MLARIGKRTGLRPEDLQEVTLTCCPRDRRDSPCRIQDSDEKRVDLRSRAGSSFSSSSVPSRIGLRCGHPIPPASTVAKQSNRTPRSRPRGRLRHCEGVQGRDGAVVGASNLGAHRIQADRPESRRKSGADQHGLELPEPVLDPGPRRPFEERLSTGIEALDFELDRGGFSLRGLERLGQGSAAAPLPDELDAIRDPALECVERGPGAEISMGRVFRTPRVSVRPLCSRRVERRRRAP